VSALKSRYFNLRRRLQEHTQLRYPLLYGFLRKLRGEQFQVLSLEYPVSNVMPRYGYGKPPYAPVLDAIEASRGRIRAELDEVVRTCERLRDIPEHRGRDSRKLFWRNGWFSGIDGMVLYAFIGKYRPATYLEIGSGNSTKFARRAVDDFALSTRIVSIDPHPRAEIDSLCDEVIRLPLESVDPRIFGMLKAGDILSFDGSHRSFMNTDVTAFFLDILPSLPPGVLVQIHDIFLPNDYVPGTPYFNEQYLLATYLVAYPSIEILMPNAFVCRDAELKSRPLALWHSWNQEEEVLSGCSFWFSKTA